MVRTFTVDVVALTFSTGSFKCLTLNSIICWEWTGRRGGDTADYAFVSSVWHACHIYDVIVYFNKDYFGFKLLGNVYTGHKPIIFYILYFIYAFLTVLIVCMYIVHKALLEHSVLKYANKIRICM